LSNQSHGSGAATSFVVSLVSNLVAFAFGSKETLLNPDYATPIWNVAIQLPLVGSYISTYLNAQLLLEIVSFLVVWVVLFSIVGMLGKIFGGAAPIILLIIGDSSRSAWLG
jgi:hypothetical protein